MLFLILAVFALALGSRGWGLWWSFWAIIWWL